jgi:hypothetical protein
MQFECNQLHSEFTLGGCERWEGTGDRHAAWVIRPGRINAIWLQGPPTSLLALLQGRPFGEHQTCCTPHHPASTRRPESVIIIHLTSICRPLARTMPG